MPFKLSNLNSNLALTLGYLNPALNNSALKYIFEFVFNTARPASNRACRRKFHEKGIKRNIFLKNCIYFLTLPSGKEFSQNSILRWARFVLFFLPLVVVVIGVLFFFVGLYFFHIFSFCYWLISLSFYFWPLASASARFCNSRISGKTNKSEELQTLEPWNRRNLRNLKKWLFYYNFLRLTW